jgi:tyrosine-protein kinase Etk/Wzc
MNRTGTPDQEFETAAVQKNGIDLFDILLVFSESRRRIAIFVLISMILGATVSVLMKPTFKAAAVILPPQQGQSLSSMMGQLGSLISLTGGGGGALKSPSDLYVGLLGSQTIADHLIAKFHLEGLYKTKTMEDTRTTLRGFSRFLATKDDLIHITVEDHDPKRASEMANAYVDELHELNSHLAISEAAQRRVFFDRELVDEKNALTTAENNLKQFEEKSGVIQLGGQSEALIQSIAQIRAEIASREVQIQSLRTYATDQNPEAVRTQQEINSLREQLARLEQDPRNTLMNSAGMPAGRVPAVTLEYARRLREVKFHDSLYELLSRQYEAARIDEAKAAPIIQVVDPATPPDKKSGPHRTLITLGFGVIGFCIACVWSVALNAFRRMEQVPEYALKIAQLRRGLRLRR